IFARYSSLQAQIGSAFVRWPRGSLERVRALASRHPDSAVARLHLSLAEVWAGHDGQALAAWRATTRIDPDSPSAVQARDPLHPRFARGLPSFVPTFAPSPAILRLPAARQAPAPARA